MDSLTFDIPGRSITSCIFSATRTHVRNRYDMGCDGEGSRIQSLFYRSAESAQTVQVQYRVCAGQYHRYDHIGLRTVCAVELADQRFHCDITYEHDCGESSVDAYCAESGFDDFLFLVEYGYTRRVSLIEVTHSISRGSVHTWYIDL